MDVDKQEWETLHRALNEWQREGLLSEDRKQALAESIHRKRSDRQEVARYFFLIAISCAALAFGAIFIDDKILERLKVYFSLSNLVIAFMAAAVGGIWLLYMYRSRAKCSANTYEVYVTGGALLLQIAVLYTCKETGYGKSYNGLLLGSTVSLFCISLLMQSAVIWLAALLSSAAWFAAVTTAWGHDYMFIGMNYPMRMTVYGLLLYLISYLQKNNNRLGRYWRLSNITGMLLFFIGMWMVSIFGNYGHLDEWAKVRQTQILFYSILFGIISLAALYWGVKRKDDALRDVSVLFLLLNIYTRYFEYFWDHTNKGIFFLILAASFYLVGRWLNGRKQKEVNTAG